MIFSCKQLVAPSGAQPSEGTPCFHVDGMAVSIVRHDNQLAIILQDEIATCEAETM